MKYAIIRKMSMKNTGNPMKKTVKGHIGNPSSNGFVRTFPEDVSVPVPEEVP